MIGTIHLPGPLTAWVGAGVLFVLFAVVGALLFFIALRKSLRGRNREAADEFAWRQPGTDNPAAFMSASMQAVIQKLREQEKELARLHQLEKQRALETERLSEAVTRNMPTGLLLVNSSGLITLSNPAAEKALGIGGMAYRRCSEVFGADSALTCLLEQCLEEGRTFQREEVEHTTPADELRHLGVTISPILPSSGQAPARPEGLAPGKATGALCLLSDLTQLAALQNQIRLQQNLAALGEMSAGIAHEFKNALATISGYAQIIRNEATGDLADCARRIVSETQALTHVVTEFLRFARPLTVADEVVALSPLVEQVVAEVGEAMPEVQLTTEGPFGLVAGDEGLLKQALLNLARNAAEAVRAKGSAGRVTLRGGREEKAGQAVQRVSVLDNGPGITPEDFNKLFIPFYTTKAEGTGLGLALVQKIVLQHGGQIEARNRPAGGAEFTLWLPIRRQAEVPTVASASHSI